MNFLIFNQVSHSVLCSKENTINKSISIQCRVINSNVNHKTYRISMLKFNQQFLIHISSFSEAVFILQKNNTGKLKRSIHEVFPNFCFNQIFKHSMYRVLENLIKTEIKKHFVYTPLSFSVFIYFGETVFKCMIIFYTNRLGEWVFSWFWRPLDKTDATQNAPISSKGWPL